MTRFRMLFVCTGNTCRSPLAEAIARKIAIERGLPHIEVASAGTGAGDGLPASDGSLLVGMERHMDLAGHRSQPLTRTLVEESDLILAMSGQHLERIQALGGGDKGYLLTSYPARGATGRGIGDPVGADLTVYRDTADELEEEIRRVFDRIMPAATPDDTSVAK